MNDQITVGTLQVFNSHNTCTEKKWDAISGNDLNQRARKLSLDPNVFKTIASAGDSWVEWENGRPVSWSI